ncbi:16S rRNA (cytidine(1402)-2'-O)-methyltransferase [Prochlorococcus marinus]|uniref:Ribosomal RNA small subunit methyltransferase I n=1 Tax=Prochlorococcus marinus (strain MIT 9211) TaxID=93059 RepID=A9BBJ9_PROM4|nr:16S rRNA (cytidine(1402)-2'-O)-methyltransferase [Prochlorococcus marinus]ABX09211.1 putative tetrapyrrole methylase family protein [Prochlorococcus marinus str. MIT 9211]
MDFLENEALGKSSEPTSGNLYIIGTPIGNLGDLSPRAKSILQKVSLIACEDTRHSGQLLKKLGIKNNLISFHKHNTQSRLPKLLKCLKEGQNIGLISDAGLPGISDPGEELVKAAKEAGYSAICIPGPCAITTALVSSGLPSQKFCFEGFLPSKTKDRNKALSSIANEERTTVIYESPKKLIKLLEQLYELCGEDRPVQVARELTKKYEEHIGPTLGEVLKHFKENKPKGECTIVLGGTEKYKKKIANQSQTELLKKMEAIIKTGASANFAAKQISNETKLSKRFLYELLHNKSNLDSQIDTKEAK